MTPAERAKDIVSTMNGSTFSAEHEWGEKLERLLTCHIEQAQIDALNYAMAVMGASFNRFKVDAERGLDSIRALIDGAKGGG